MRICFIICLMCVVGCNTNVSGRINIDKLFMHEPSVFSAWIIDDDYNVKHVNIGNKPGDSVNIICDVNAGEPIWFNSVTNRYGYTTYYIHINSLDNMIGAGWDHGKFGKGVTIPVE